MFLKVKRDAKVDEKKKINKHINGSAQTLGSKVTYRSCRNIVCPSPYFGEWYGGSLGFVLAWVYFSVDTLLLQRITFILLGCFLGQTQFRAAK